MNKFFNTRSDVVAKFGDPIAEHIFEGCGISWVVESGRAFVLVLVTDRSGVRVESVPVPDSFDYREFTETNNLCGSLLLNEMYVRGYLLDRPYVIVALLQVAVLQMTAVMEEMLEKMEKLELKLSLADVIINMSGYNQGIGDSGYDSGSGKSKKYLL